MLFDSYQLYLIERDHSESYPPNLDIDRYRISSIPYCNRKQYFAKIGLENKSGNYLQRAAHEGRMHHLDAQIAAEEFAERTVGVTAVCEEDLEIAMQVDDLPILLRGKMDIVWTLPTGRMQIIDIKATASKGWYNTRNYGAYQSHMDQVLIYDWGYRKVYNPTQPPITCLWYKNRNDGQWQEQVVQYNKDRVEVLIEKLEDLVRAAREEIPPDNFSPMYAFECQSKSGTCPFYNLCYDNGEFKKHRKEDDNDE